MLRTRTWCTVSPIIWRRGHVGRIQVASSKHTHSISEKMDMVPSRQMQDTKVAKVINEVPIFMLKVAKNPCQTSKNLFVPAPHSNDILRTKVASEWKVNQRVEKRSQESLQEEAWGKLYIYSSVGGEPTSIEFTRKGQVRARLTSSREMDKFAWKKHVRVKESSSCEVGSRER
jgi:hypothetical protein